MEEEKKEKTGSESVMVHIVGSNHLLNDLLCRFLNHELAIECEIHPYTQNTVKRIIDDISTVKTLVLVDCMDIDIAQLWAGFSLGDQGKNPLKFLALFNIDPDLGIERQAVDHGVRGVFYRNDPAAMFSRGVVEILKGELWYSRKAMSEFLIQNRSAAKFKNDAVNTLTIRERDILVGIASGASNKEIAEDLGISLHTVKTHIYNIYKKIKVPNRLQAALWAAQYL